MRSFSTFGKTVLLSLIYVSVNAARGADALPPLFSNGTSVWTVVVAENAAPPEKFAAEEFVNAVEKCSRVKLPVAPSTNGIAHAVIIGADDCGDNFADEICEIKVKNGNLLLTGNQPRTALHAVYVFLQGALGVRWLWPGPSGEIIYQLSDLPLPAAISYRHTPSVKYRGFHHCGDWRDRTEFNLWQTRNFANIHRHGIFPGEEKYGQYSMPSMHNANLNGEKELFASNPECFALIAGHRSMANICFTSDLGAMKVAERIGKDIEGRMKRSRVDIISIFPNDNQEYCQCDECRKLGVSTAWFRYFGKITAALHERFPELRFATIAYQGYLDVPDCEFKNVEFVEYASHPRCHIHKWDDPNCQSNVSELKRLRQWTSRKDVKTGHYAYEYDNGGRHPIFMPFFSIIDDAVATCVREGLVTSIPEVSLSPKSGPDAKAHAIQNRLSILLYAWKMWDANITLEYFYDDVTRHAFGAAEKEMKEYFKLLDKAWGRQPGRITLFADGMNMAANMLGTGDTRQKAEELLALAEKKVKDHPWHLANIHREKTLFRQMTSYCDLKSGTGGGVNVPRCGEDGELVGEKVPWHNLVKVSDTSREKKAAAKVRAAWNSKELILDWTSSYFATFVLTADYGEEYTFDYFDGVKDSKKISSVGVEERLDENLWTVQKTATGLRLIIPLNIFTLPPAAGDRWSARFETDDDVLPEMADATVGFNFIQSASADRPVVYVVPTLDNEGQRNSMLYGIPSARDTAELDGWKLLPATNGTQLAEIASKAKTYMFLVPVARDVSPETAETIRKNVSEGGTLLVRSWLDIPLSKILGDDALASHCAAPKDYPLSERKARFVLEGDWYRKPWNIENAIRRTYSPCYMQVGTTPAGAWKEYAGMPSKKDETKMVPFVSAMKYGKGVIIIVGETLHVSHFKLIDNIRADLLGKE